jgi:hypothetical protein
MSGRGRLSFFARNARGTKSMNVACVRALLLSVLLGCLAVPARAESPAPRKSGEYLPVEDVPKRQDPAMSPDDRAKLVKELTAARDRQTSHVKPKDGAKPAKP